MLDLSGLQNCNKLKLLSIKNNKLKELKGLKGLSNLIELDLSDNQINSLEVASILPQLQRLNLYNNSFKNLKDLKFFPGLIHLQVGGNDIEILDVQYPLTTLETLKADKNPIKQLGQLKGLNNLLYLYVSYAQIKNLGLLELEKLELLDVSHNLITELGGFQPNPSLKEINLNNNPIINLEPMLKWQQLKIIGIKDTNIEYLSLELQETKKIKMDGNFGKELMGKTMMKDYLKSNIFVKTAPSSSGTLIWY